MDPSTAANIMSSHESSSSSSSTTTTTTTTGPKRNESDVYDRQIRLWGADAQAKMARARVLYVHVTGLSSEVLKNLVLAGIGADLCDNRPPGAAANSPSFFLNGEREAKRRKYPTVAEAVKPNVDQLNPLLDPCRVLDKSVDELTKDDVQKYTVVVASRVTMTQAVKLARWVTEGGGALYHADSFGLYGACAVDLGPNRPYRPEKGKELLDETSVSPYVPLESMFLVPFDRATNRFHKLGPPAPYVLWRSLLEYVETNHQWPSSETADAFCASTIEWVRKTSPSSLAAAEEKGEAQGTFSDAVLRGVAQVATAEIAPVCSVLGGLVGNEIIKVISGKGEPANNTILFEGTTCKAFTFLVKAKE